MKSAINPLTPPAPPAAPTIPSDNTSGPGVQHTVHHSHGGAAHTHGHMGFHAPIGGWTGGENIHDSAPSATEGKHVIPVGRFGEQTVADVKTPPKGNVT